MPRRFSLRQVNTRLCRGLSRRWGHRFRPEFRPCRQEQSRTQPGTFFWNAHFPPLPLNSADSDSFQKKQRQSNFPQPDRLLAFAILSNIHANSLPVCLETISPAPCWGLYSDAPSLILRQNRNCFSPPNRMICAYDKSARYRR
jgi:hypothetical protein